MYKKKLTDDTKKCADAYTLKEPNKDIKILSFGYKPTVTVYTSGDWVIKI